MGFQRMGAASWRAVFDWRPRFAQAVHRFGTYPARQIFTSDSGFAQNMLVDRGFELIEASRRAHDRRDVSVNGNISML